MSCDEHQQNISKLLDGMLDNDQMPGVFAHLGECEECRSSSNRHWAFGRQCARHRRSPYQRTSKRSYEALEEFVKGLRRIGFLLHLQPFTNQFDFEFRLSPYCC
jgi:predicted anti-sigma-YlaC factor YlaD